MYVESTQKRTRNDPKFSTCFVKASLHPNRVKIRVTTPLQSLLNRVKMAKIDEKFMKAARWFATNADMKLSDSWMLMAGI